MKPFAGKVVLITGAGSGIGRATALRFAEEGATVVVADIDEERGEQTSQELKNGGSSVLFVRADVSNSSDVENLVDSTIRVFGKLDCAVNNAGILGKFGGLAEQTETDFDRGIGVNLKGVWLCMKYEIRAMRRQLQSSIVNVSSINGIHSAAGAPIYSAAKHGILGLTKSAALEYGVSGIRINAICPGAAMTQMLEQSFKGTLPNLKMQIPVKRIAEPIEVAQSIVWLCSDQASYVTGNVFICDGGVLAQ